jgi:hypothetical protein
MIWKPSGISHQHSAISIQPSAFSHQLSAFSSQWLALWSQRHIPWVASIRKPGTNEKLDTILSFILVADG